ncbi:MAG: hypothetical protein ABIP71_14450 [Verrucomicrobiota bacterium]
MESKSKKETTRDVEQTRAEAKRAFREAGDVWSGKNAVASAWRSTKGTYLRAQDKVVESVEATDDVIRSNLYSSIGIALGVGAIIGFFCTNKPTRTSGRGKF